jgi:AbrB family looped-hinge helix DNA binding protein
MNLPFFPKPKLIAIAQLNEKSQLVIPKDARDAIRIGPGDRVVVALAPLGKALVIAKPEDLENHLNHVLSESQQSFTDMKSELSRMSEEEQK